MSDMDISMQIFRKRLLEAGANEQEAADILSHADPAGMAELDGVLVAAARAPMLDRVHMIRLVGAKLEEVVSALLVSLAATITARESGS